MYFPHYRSLVYHELGYIFRTADLWFATPQTEIYILLQIFGLLKTETYFVLAIICGSPAGKFRTVCTFVGYEKHYFVLGIYRFFNHLFDYHTLCLVKLQNAKKKMYAVLEVPRVENKHTKSVGFL